MFRRAGSWLLSHVSRLERSVSQSTFNSPEERLGEVRNLIAERGAVRIDELAADFGVSEMTIRRDLDELETLGVARRVRGGAIALGPEPFAATPSPQCPRQGPDRRETAAARSPSRERLPSMPQPPSTGWQQHWNWPATSSSSRNGLDTFNALVGKPGITASLSGGSQEPRTGSLVGPMAVRAAESFLYDAFICSAAALDHEVGSSEASLAESEVKRAFSQTSGRIILAVDHTKLGTRAQARMFDLENVDFLVTDLDPDDARLDTYRPQVELA